jgi:hypothetical protein
MPEPTPRQPADPDDPDAAAREMRFERPFGITRQVPGDVLPPEAVARLRAGGELTPEELARVRAAALGEGPLGRLVGRLMAGGKQASRDEAHGPGGSDTVASETVRQFAFEWRPTARPDQPEPATYYEAFTGQQDPARDVFIRARRVINGVVWAIALGLPVAVIVLTIATGQSAQTVVVAAVAAAVVGMMFRSSFPRTPFG